MCGISGIFDRAGEPVDKELLERMTSTIQHRGPDSSGVWFDAPAGIGFVHRRLSIIDLSEAGHQPMPSARGRFMITYNGELYNTAEIRLALMDRGIVFQSPCLLPWMTAFENVMLSVDQSKTDWTKAKRRDHAEKYLSLVGLSDALHKKPAELSQGMRQRVGIARAFALTPKLLLLDEPFGMLDSLTRIELQHVLLELWTQERMTAVMVTHDIDEAIFMADRVVMMTNGPRAKIGDILTVPFERPRMRHELLENSEFYALREHLVGFLEDMHHPQPASPASV